MKSVLGRQETLLAAACLSGSGIERGSLAWIYETDIIIPANRPHEVRFSCRLDSALWLRHFVDVPRRV